ncbi:MAG: hypothetical protein GTO45_24080 [Candidatus Aminicenantes bacterium]|nr:hypothetical protein [Candidatus Aminicenantes bacterium]NIM81831.1 hypothetical protein [Candidatus Aminicenantes bacterium]NIN21204.1 hypothetical protein [Candidatus Aminicenantes bacterium]NIN45028.1 hypothetical protein [Candidatus Aminicenantes bacterium]NIN87846.1 hypothetical protein [Candidatus Aminicenantes bacterium]
MSDLNISNEIMPIKSREQMIRYMDGYSAERMEELDGRKIRRPLVKSYMLEHVGDSGNVKSVTDILNSQGIVSTRIDNKLFKLQETKTEDNEYMGFLEILSPRYFVIYTLHESQKSDRWVKNLVYNSPELDHVWLSGLTFNVLWERVVQLNRPNRYARILFQHESIYQIDNDPELWDEDEEEVEEDYMEIVERRASKFSLVDKISVVQEKLNQLQEIYFPLYAISQLRFPSPVGRGGHDFYSDGKVTNRSGNFRDHRSHIIYIQRIYDELMKITEDKVWYSIQDQNIRIPRTFQKLIGSPLSIKFKEPLNQETFDYWVKSTFSRSRNKFRLWGNPIKLGPRKIHVYGVDRHLWQPIFLEITDKHLLAIIPKGTCGNTVHRLVTNIQSYIDPAADVYVGKTKYSDIAEMTSRGVKYDSSR